jgi:tRNA(Arg) A34 adenosine deaminase TadA
MQVFYLKKTLTIAKQSVKNGNHPFGALLVLDGQIVAESENTVITDLDVTRHAELNLISNFIHRFSPSERERMTLYSSTEPCAMCTGAIVWSGIKRIIYGCSSEELKRIAKGKFSIECRNILDHSKDRYYVEGPLLEEEAAQIHLEFWK